MRILETKKSKTNLCHLILGWAHGGNRPDSSEVAEEALMLEAVVSGWHHLQDVMFEQPIDAGVKLQTPDHCKWCPNRPSLAALVTPDGYTLRESMKSKLTKKTGGEGNEPPLTGRIPFKTGSAAHSSPGTFFW